MTCERADDKCEGCGKKFGKVQSRAEFTDVLYCAKCRKNYAPCWTELEDFDDTYGFLIEDEYIN